MTPADRRQPGHGDRRAADLAALYGAITAAYKCVESSRRSVTEAAESLEAARRDLEACRRALLEHWPETPPPLEISQTEADPNKTDPAK